MKSLVYAATIVVLVIGAVAVGRFQTASAQDRDIAGQRPDGVVSCTPAPGGLISWWRGEGNAKDVRSGNDGVLLGDTTYAAGKVGQAFSMDGNGDYVEIPNSGNLNPANITLETWVNFASLDSTTVGNVPGTQRLIQKQNQRSGAIGLFSSYELVKTRVAGLDKMYFCIDTNAGSEVCVGAATTIAAGQWCHVAATYDAQFAKIYVNGNLEGTVASTQPLEYSNKPVLLGRTNDPAFDGHLNGLLDEPAIYGRALDATEIQNIFNAGTLGKCLPSCTPAPNGLVSWYRGESNANDSRGGNSGSLQNGATFATGQVGQAISFDGVDDFVQISGHPSLDVGAGGGMTIETWINPTSIASQKPIVEWNAGGTVGTHLWYSVTSVGGVTGNIFFNMIDVNNISHFIQTPAVMTANEFQHIAATYDKTSGIVTIYRNGVVVDTANLGSGFTPRTGPAFNLYLGTRPGSGIFHQGLLDETSIYDSALTLTQIQNIYNAGSLGKCSNSCSTSTNGLISWYRGENSAIDAHSGNNGALQNGATFAVGKVGQGISFDGVDDRVEIADSASLKPAAVTVEAWVKFNSLTSTTIGASSGTQYIVFKKNSRVTNFEGYTLLKTSGNQLSFVVSSASGSQAVATGTTIVTTGTFYHLVGTFDSTSAKVYVNGQLEGTAPGNFALDYDNLPVYLGGTGLGFYDGKFNGVLDEASIFNRAITPTEIQDIFIADSAGKCSVCLSPPANLNSWLPADVNASDIQSGNTNASMIGDTVLSSDAKVGKAFSFDGNGDYVLVPDAPEQKPADQLTFEGWYKFNSLGAGLPHLIAKPLRNSPFDSYAIWFDNGNIRIGYQQVGGGFLYYDTGFVPQLGVYYHFAYTLDTTDSGPTANTMRLYINGVQYFSGAAGLPIYYNGVNDSLLPHPMLIGADLENNNPQFFLNGKADEVSLYSRILTPAEIQAIFDAQTAGKCHGVCTAPPAGLVSMYRGENNALDSRSHIDGTLQGGASFANGKVGQAFNFDGIDDGVDLGTSFVQQQFSVSMWVKPGSTQVAYANIIDNNHDCCTNWEIEQNGGNTNQYYFSGTGVFNLTPNVWQHLVITQDGSNVGRVYLNGSLVASATFPIPISNPFLRLGRAACCGGRFWNGQMDEVAIFSRSLSASEVQLIYAADSAGFCKPTAAAAPNGQLAWFTGDGDAFDTSGKGNNGTLNNGAKFTVGKVGQSFDLDGVDDFVSIPDGPSVRPASALTVEGWFKFDAINDFGGTGNHMVSKALGASFGDSYVLWLGSGRIWVGVGDGPTSGTFFDTGYGVQTGVWYHIAMTFDDATNSLRCFVNGVEVASTTTNVTITYDNHPLVIGSDITNETNNFFNDGQEDEVSLYDRALAPTEINSIYNAGIAGKLTAATTITTNNLVSVWRGEGNANDAFGGNNGSLSGGTLFTSGWLGQAFALDGSTDTVVIPDSPSLNFASNATITVETWAYRTSTNAIQHLIGKRNNCDGSPINYQIAYAANQVYFGSAGNEIGSGVDLPLNKWTHIAGTFDGSTLRIYINGNLAGSLAGSLGLANSAPLLIGGSGTCATFGGALDEVAIYGRALSPTEIAAQFAAKSPVATGVGDVTVRFQSVTTAGTTQEIPLDPASLPGLPSAATQIGLTYDVATSAVYTGNIDLCFNVPSLSSIPLSELRIFHLESGAWVNRTASGATYSALCTTGVTSLSPFAIGRLIPSAANASVSGRVLTAGGQGIRNAIITLTDSSGHTRRAATGSLGYYKFDDVAAGETYIVTIHSKRFTFENATRVIAVSDDVTDADFISLE